MEHLFGAQSPSFVYERFEMTRESRYYIDLAKFVKIKDYSIEWQSFLKFPLFYIANEENQQKNP